MGRTVVAVIGVAVAVAIAVAAPYIAVGVLGFVAGTTSAAIATAVIGLTLSIGASLAFRALGVGAPSAKLATAPPYPQGTANVDRFGPKPKLALEKTMAPVNPPPLVRFWWWGFARFRMVELIGDCLLPRNSDSFAIVDMKATIRKGDLFAFGIRDLARAWPGQPELGGAVKRFLGVNHKLQVLECDCTRPPSVIHTGLTNLIYAHRVRATAPTRKEAKRLLRAIRRDPATFDTPLMD